MPSFYEDVFAVVKKIPKGKVTTYGLVALYLGKPRASRAVGYALNSLKKDQLQEVPWQRVINSKREITFKGDVMRATLQKKLLEREGIEFGVDGKVDFERYLWNGKKQKSR